MCLWRKNLIERERPGENAEALIRRQGEMNPELRWRVNFRRDSKLSWSRRGGGRERWRCRESVSFAHISCQFHLQHYLWHLQRAARDAIQPGCACHLQAQGLLAPGGGGGLAASHCPSCSEPLFPGIWHWPCPGASPAAPCGLFSSPQQKEFSWGDFSSKIQKCIWATAFFVVDLFDC